LSREGEAENAAERCAGRNEDTGRVGAMRSLPD
jgi:hypothetical protein